MTIRRLAGVAAAALVLVFAGPAAAGDSSSFSCDDVEEVGNAQFHAGSVWPFHSIEIA